MTSSEGPAGLLVRCLARSQFSRYTQETRELCYRETACEPVRTGAYYWNVLSCRATCGTALKLLAAHFYTGCSRLTHLSAPSAGPTSYFEQRAKD